MKKIERIFCEILYRVYEQNELFLNQKLIVRECQVSPGMVNTVVSRLERLGAVEKKPFGFIIVDPKRILLYWAFTRNLWKDIVYTTYVSISPKTIETLPPDTILTAHAGYACKFKKEMSKFDFIFVYGNPDKIRQQYPPSKTENPNLFVLSLDDHLSKVSVDGVAPIGLIYVDLYNLGTSGKALVSKLDKKFESLRIDAFRTAVQEVRKKFE